MKNLPYHKTYERLRPVNDINLHFPNDARMYRVGKLSRKELEKYLLHFTPDEYPHHFNSKLPIPSLANIVS